MDVDIPYDDAECAEWCDEDGWCKGIRGKVGDCHGHVSALSDSGGRDGTEEWLCMRRERAAHLLQGPLRDYGISYGSQLDGWRGKHSLVEIPAHHIGFLRYA